MISVGEVSTARVVGVMVAMEIGMIASIWYIMCNTTAREPGYVWKDWDEKGLNRE